MDALEKKEHLNNLYDIYKDLLTEKQRSYFESYYYFDLSLKEISENNNVSRNAVFSALENIELILEEYESKLKLREKNLKIDKIKDYVFNNSNIEIDVLKELLEDLE